MQAFPIAAALVGGGLSAAGNVMAGRERSRAQAYESDQKKRQAQQFEIAGAQAEARRREQLTSSLETIQAIRSGRGVGMGSPTGMASLEEISSDESRDIRADRLNYMTRAEESNLASKLAKKQSKMSLISGYVAGAADVANTAFKITGTRR